MKEEEYVQNNQKDTSKKESENLVTFPVHGKPIFQDETSSHDVPIEQKQVLLSHLNAKRFKDSPLQEQLYEYWKTHTASVPKIFNDWLSELWDESNQRFRYPGT